MSERTIAAIATPLGESSIGVIRISGADAVAVADKVFFSFSGEKLKTLSGYRAAYGQIKDGEQVLDDAVALVFRSPKSYTGEDVVEISVHGGRLMIKSVFRLILASGAFLAEPGEFTKRAFLNGKTDLVRAESIMGLISARSNAQLKLSRAAHNGRVSEKMDDIEAKLLKTAASIAAYSDYPDEDIEGLNFENFEAMLRDAKDTISEMLLNYDAGRILREGVDTVIVGKPNVGKSTLMNMLSGAERSIVTEIAGTTRDVIEDTVLAGDIPLRLADTAGIRETDDIVEKAGVDRARKRLDTAQLILAVFDCTKKLDEDDFSLLREVKDRNTIVIINKSDKQSRIDMDVFGDLRVVQTSAKHGEGYDALVKEVAAICGISQLDTDCAILAGERQRACAERALNAVVAALETLTSGCTFDAVGVCIDDALAAILELTGKRVTNEVSDEIFRRFCVGK